MSTACFYPKSLKLEAAREVAAGTKTVLQICNQFNVSKQAIYKWMLEAGVNTPRQDRCEFLDNAELIKLYKSGLSFDSIGRLKNVSNSAIKKRIEKVAPEIIRRKGWKRTYVQVKQEPDVIGKPIKPVALQPKAAPVNVLPPSSIRQLTKQELMQGKAGGYRISPNLEGLHSHGRESRPYIQQEASSTPQAARREDVSTV